MKVLLLTLITVAMLQCSSAWCQALDPDEALICRAKTFLVQKYPLGDSSLSLKEMNRVNTSALGAENPEILFSRFDRYWVGIDVKKDGKLIRTLLLRFKVVRTMDVICTARAIRGRELVTPGDLIMEKRTLDAGSPQEKNLVTSAAWLEGRRARYYMAEGMILTKEKLELIPPVQKYEDAQVLIRKDEYAIGSIGKALDDGFSGSKVRVRLENGKVLQGFVNSDGLVEITLK